MSIALAKLRFSHLTHVWELNVAYRQTNGNGSVQMSQSAAEAIGNAWILGLLPHLSVQTEFESVYVRIVDDGPFPTKTNNLNNRKGGVSSSAMPSLITMVANFRNNAGLSKRPGRVNISGLPEDVLTGGMFDPTYRQQVEDDLNDNVINVQNSGPPEYQGKLVIAVRAAGPAPPIPYASYDVDKIEIPVEPGSRLSRKGRKLGRKDAPP